MLIAKCLQIPSKKVGQCGFVNMIYYYAFYSHFNPKDMYSYIYCTIFPYYTSSIENRVIISEALHTDKFSIIDDAYKIPVTVNTGICIETGDRMYDLHGQRELYSIDAELFDAFTGHNNIQPNNTSPLHPACTVVIKATTTAKRPSNIQGYTKFFSPMQVQVHQED